VTLGDAMALEPGTLVREREFGLEGRFVGVGVTGLYAEIDHDYEGGGFDYWPLRTLEVIVT
jgi:hypothetical protein